MGRSKYQNIATMTSDGIRHDSRKEARRWSELCLLERAGVISDLKRQVKYVLIPSQVESYERFSPKTGHQLKNGIRTIEKECCYIADFVYIDVKTGETIVEDAKGMRTEAYRIKRKLMLWVHGIRIKET